MCFSTADGPLGAQMCLCEDAIRSRGAGGSMEPPKETAGRNEAHGTGPGLFTPRWLQLPERYLIVTSGGLGWRARSLKRDGRGHASRVLSFWNHLTQSTGTPWFLLRVNPAPVLGDKCMPKPPMLLLRSCLPVSPASCHLSSCSQKCLFLGAFPSR